ncbi:hypothetical protein KIN20_036438 [Parelaphostrongylus tenuis]|uniref:Homologous-pairing protein 2 winged helix domain-containing protein n=1 Tax=Parelaphostrongylus tenuis TaxID=148309 RepID=A0AAD5RG36_PARTN|nr:hypothetical protein KIN20_036438 [Parelaphostrongylus tenuis]
MSKNDLEQRASAKITEYMIEQNRPYSATDVFTNLRQEFGKNRSKGELRNLVLKVLESLAASGTLKEKMIGKQKIFYANQENFEVCDEAAIADFDSKINCLSEELRTLTAQNREIQNELKDLVNMLTTKDLRSKIAELQAKISNMKSRLAKLETSRDPLIAEKGKKAVEWSH